MAIDAGGVWPNPAARRGTLSAFKLRVREERKKIIRISNAKYRTIDDHESGLHRFVLIRNTLRRLQREAREEKLARHRALGANVSPSYLSASRPRSPSPPIDMQVSDVMSIYAQPPTPITALDDDDDLPPPKRPKLYLEDDDKENDRVSSSCDSRLECDMDEVRKDDDEATRMMIVDDTQEILRDLYETYTYTVPECLNTSNSCSPLTTSSPTITTTSSASSPLGTTTSAFSSPRPDSPSYTAAYSSCTLPSTTPSLAATSNNINSLTSNNSNISHNNSSNTVSSTYHDWSRPQQHQQYACGHTSLLGNDLQSVVFHSLIASLES